jgi:hypothetical protein
MDPLAIAVQKKILGIIKNLRKETIPMANSIGPNATHSIRPRIVELINGMTEDQCRKLFENMQAMDKDTSKEQRSVLRVDFQCPVYIEGIPGQQTIKDLGIGGAFVACDSSCRDNFSTGELIKLTIKPSNEDKVIRVQAQIVNFSDRGMHCKFAHLDRRTADAIRHWLNMA